MSARRSGPGARILAIAQNLYPGYFALVMATGALSIALYLHGYETLARALALNVFAYAVLAALLVLRLLLFPRRVAADMTEHARAPGFLTVVAGTCVLGTNLALTGELAAPAMILWEIGIALADAGARKPARHRRGRAPGAPRCAAQARPLSAPRSLSAHPDPPPPVSISSSAPS